jgi:hypothetical protein
MCVGAAGHGLRIGPETGPRLCDGQFEAGLSSGIEAKAVRRIFMRWSLFVLAVAVPFVSHADVTSSSPRKVDPAAIQRRAEEAARNYRRGVQFAKGDGVDRNYTQAARLYRLAAEAGYAPAQYDLAYLYAHGLGVEHDMKQAANWYRKAAEQGDAEAENNFGVLYATGNGVPHDDAEAVRWYALSAAQNDPEGTNNLGMMYLQGRGVARDPVEAFRLFLKAAGQGHAIAQNNLALMYANGQAVSRDYVRAYAWFDLAAGELSGSATLRDRIAKEMTPEEIVRARDLAASKRGELAKAEETSK